MVDIQVDTTDFDRKLAEYMNYTKRTVPEIIATKCYFIARNATMTTTAVPKAKVRMEMVLSSTDYPRAPLAAILVNKRQGDKNESGFYGKEMNTAINKYIRIRENATNYLKAGWIGAIKRLAPHIKSKAGQPPLDTKAKQKGAIKGGATVPLARDNWVAVGEIWNSIMGNKRKHGPEVPKILEKGLAEAMAKEVISMDAYIKSKMDPAAVAFSKNG